MRNNVKFYLNRALSIAISDRKSYKHFFLGAIGIRADGASVSATNVRTMLRCGDAHAEARLSRKLDVGSIVYVARAAKNGDWAMSRPCPLCERALRNKGVKKVYYTIGPNEFGCIILNP